MRAEDNFWRTFGSGGAVYTFEVSHNFTDGGKTAPQYGVRFYHYLLGTLRGTLNPAGEYDPANRSARFTGTGTFRNKPVNIEVNAQEHGGIYGQGVVRFYIWEDTDRDGRVDPGEPTLLLMGPESGFPARATLCQNVPLRKTPLRVPSEPGTVTPQPAQ